MEPLYIDGELANGVYEGIYYQDGFPFTGVYDGTYYVDGSLATGYPPDDTYIYYVDGLPATGLYNGTYFANGGLANGVYEGTYYVYGSPGYGVYDGTYYAYGSVGTGVYEGTYYVDGSVGTGTYEDQYYLNGFLISEGPLYIRATGNDATGDGSLAAPLKTAQKAFETAYNATGDFVLDLGEGNFGGVRLLRLGEYEDYDGDFMVRFNASEWPSRISVGGVSSALSNLGGIFGSDLGPNDVNPPAPKAITITSDLSVNIGDISVPGFDAGPQEHALNYSYATNGASVTLINVKAGNINANGGNYGSLAGSGGAINLLGSAVGNIYSNGGNVSDQGRGSGGSVTLDLSTAESISVFGSITETGFAGIDGAGGSVELLNGSTAASISGLAGILRAGGQPFTGLYDSGEGNRYYKDGVIGTGTYDSGDGSGIKYYEDGVLGTGTYEDKYYSEGVLFTGTYVGIYYQDGVPFTGLYNDDGTGNRLYVDGTRANGNYGFSSGGSGTGPGDDRGFGNGGFYQDGLFFTGVLGGVIYILGYGNLTGSIDAGDGEKYYKDGVPFTGLYDDVYGNRYYKNGVLGTGVYEGIYYVGGSVANGVYEGTYYDNGSAGTGLYEGTYYKDGSVGTGLYDGGEGNRYYKDGVLGTGTFDDGSGEKYYVDGVLTARTGLYDLDGNGIKYYVNGVLGTGVFEGRYYVDGVPSTGSYNGGYYLDGDRLYPASALPQPSQVQAGVSYGNGLTGTLSDSNAPQPWDNYTYYGQGDVVSEGGYLWLLASTGGWTVGGRPSLGYGWQRLSTGGGTAPQPSVNLAQLLGLPPFVQL